MGPFVVVMAILGCGDAGAGCAEARLEPTHYASIQACQAAAPAVLMRNSDLDYPELQAACRSSAPRIAAAALDHRG